MMRLLPPSTIPAQVLALVVDLGPDSQGLAARSGPLPRAVEELARLLGEFQVPATWALNDTHSHDLVETILERGARHAIAIRADAAWAGPDAGRGDFSRGLSRRLQQAEAAGIEVTALAADSPLGLDNVDLLVKYGVPLVVNVTDDGEPGNVRTLRYGVWEVAASAVLPEPRGGWIPRHLFGAAPRHTRQAIDQAIQGETLCLVTIDAQRIGNPTELASVEKILRHAHRRHRQGVLSVQTLNQVAEQMQHLPQARSACSILRAA